MDQFQSVPQLPFSGCRYRSLCTGHPGSAQPIIRRDWRNDRLRGAGVAREDERISVQPEKEAAAPLELIHNGACWIGVNPTFAQCHRPKKASA